MPTSNKYVCWQVLLKAGPLKLYKCWQNHFGKLSMIWNSHHLYAQCVLLFSWEYCSDTSDSEFRRWISSQTHFNHISGKASDSELDGYQMKGTSIKSRARYLGLGQKVFQRKIQFQIARGLPLEELQN